MNVFDEFSIFNEVSIKDGKIVLDQQRVLMFPATLIANYMLKQNEDSTKAKKLYNSMKEGMNEFSMPLGKEYGLTYKGFLDRWVKYNAFGGWGLVEYRLIETGDITHGFLTYKNLTLHAYLKKKGVKDFNDVLLNGIIAGALSNTFKTDVDVIETKCICRGDDTCIFNWGPKDYIEKEFPDIVVKNRWW